jgi:PAS domain-containing protein
LRFPLALANAARWPHVEINAERWNVPKYFIASGMIVTLLEDEISLAGRQRAQYRLLFEQNPLPMWIFEPKTHEMLEVNAAAVAEYGYPREEFLSMTIDKLLDGAAGAKSNGHGGHDGSVPEDDATDPADLWRMSDAAMYRAQKSGGNGHLLFSRLADREG